MLSYTEKRRHIRVPLTFVTVEIFSEYEKVRSSETCSIIDLSISGMKFISKRHYSIGQPIRITFVLPDSTTPVRGNSIVVYQNLEGELMQTGIQFTDLGLIEYTLLKRYVESISRNN